MKNRHHFSVRGGEGRYDLVKRKVEHARGHIKTLGAKIEAFLASRPYVIATRRDADTRRLTYFAASVQNTPDELCAVAGDAFHNLRSALDYLAWQLVSAAGNTATAQTAFPVCDDSAKYADRSAVMLKGMSADAAKAIGALEPWKGGQNDLLWRLHRLDIVDKHRDWLVIASRYRSVNIMPVLARTMAEATTDPEFARMQEAFQRGPGLWLTPQATLEPLKAGDDLFIDTPDAQPDPKVQFSFDIAIHEPEVAEGEPLLPMLQKMADRVAHIAYSFASLLR
jgi:hypothetical protein